MQYNEDRVDEVTLALMYLGMHGSRVWKTYDWDALDRLHQKGFISNPISRNKSVALTLEGQELAKKLFQEHFVIDE